MVGPDLSARSRRRAARADPEWRLARRPRGSDGHRACRAGVPTISAGPCACPCPRSQAWCVTCAACRSRRARVSRRARPWEDRWPATPKPPSPGTLVGIEDPSLDRGLDGCGRIGADDWDRFGQLERRQRRHAGALATSSTGHIAWTNGDILGDSMTTTTPPGTREPLYRMDTVVANTPARPGAAHAPDRHVRQEGVQDRRELPRPVARNIEASRALRRPSRRLRGSPDDPAAQLRGEPRRASLG